MFLISDYVTVLECAKPASLFLFSAVQIELAYLNGFQCWYGAKSSNSYLELFVCFVLNTYF